MSIVGVLVLGVLLAGAAGFTIFLLVGPFIAGRFNPKERRIDHRHRIPPEKAEAKP